MTGQGQATRGCEDLEGAGFSADFARQLAWEGLGNSGSFREGEFIFADDQPDDAPATLKLEGDYFCYHPFWGRLLLAAYEAYPCLKTADVITYTPEDPRDFATELGHRTGKPVAHIRRTPGSGRQAFEFASRRDWELAGSAQRPFIVEDITTTLSSPAAVRAQMALAQMEVQAIDRPAAYAIGVHVLSILLRGQIKPRYTEGLIFHALLERQIPRQLEEFRRRYPDTRTVPNS